MSKGVIYASLETEKNDIGPDGEDELITAADLEGGYEQPQARTGFTRSLACAAAVVIGAIACIVLVVFLLHNKSMDMDAGVEKRGAGLFIVSGDQVLLLRRNSKHNDNTWGLPGGNVETGDAHLQATAMREATEEMGSVPTCNITGQILTLRGKKKQKAYTVFVCEVTVAVMAAYKPQLNDEHREARWWPLAALPARSQLHPVVVALLDDPGTQRQLVAALPSGVLPASNSTARSATLKPFGAADLEGDEKVDKRGAGLMLADGNKVMLMRKVGKHGAGKWGLPGGSADSKDRDDLATAEREAKEEVGGVPAHEVKGQILVKRKGKHGLKLHTVFLATVASGASVGFQPVANDEHLEVKWVPLSEAVAFPAAQLHPVLAEVLSANHRADLQAAFGVSV
ncbi:g8710 [Coccomyxa elongata]